MPTKDAGIQTIAGLFLKTVSTRKRPIYMDDNKPKFRRESRESRESF